MSDLKPTRPSLLQRLLGLFVAWQLIFLCWYNGSVVLADLLPSEGWTGKFAAYVMEVPMDYSFATGQFQGWRLYLGIPPRSIFASAELRWDDGDALVADGAVMVPSEVAPANPHRYFHPPGSLDRFYRCEFNLVMPVLDDKILTDNPEVWQPALSKALSGRWRPIQGYLHWQTTRYQRAHPDQPPLRQLILHAQIYESPPPDKPGSEWNGPIDLVMARWRPEKQPPPGCLPVEVFNHVTRQFEYMNDEK